MYLIQIYAKKIYDYLTDSALFVSHSWENSLTYILITK
jgi:hypothetical protein